jgi:hypothetical protein
MGPNEICPKCGGVRNASFAAITGTYAQPFAGASIRLCGCAPEKHDGHLDPYPLEDGHAEVWRTSEGIGLHVHGTKRDTYLDASQAVSLHAYLTEALSILKQLANGKHIQTKNRRKPMMILPKMAQEPPSFPQINVSVNVPQGIHLAIVLAPGIALNVTIGAETVEQWFALWQQGKQAQAQELKIIQQVRESKGK